ncbi:g2057 [Coccomyxa elongata]
MSANQFDALVDMPDDVPKVDKSRKAKKHNGAPPPQSSRLDSPGSLSSADNISLASAEQDTRETDFRQVHARRRSRSSTPSGMVSMINGGHKEEENDACSITTVAETKALLNKWTGQVVASGGSHSGDSDSSFREAFLRSKAFDKFVERYTSFGDLNSIEAPLKTLLRVLVPDDKLQVALDLAFAILRMAKRFPMSTPEDVQHCRKAAVEDGVALLKSYIAEKEQSAEMVKAQLEERRGQVIRLEIAMDGAPAPRQLQQISTRLLEEVQSRLALGSPPVGILEDIQSLECLLEKGIEDSRKSMPARREELQRENAELDSIIQQKQTEREELERKLSEVMAELDQSRARQRAVAALLAGNFSEPHISTDQLKKQMAAVQELKKAAESVLPKDRDAADFKIPNRAENAPGPEGLSPADFLKHCLSIHNRTAQQVRQRGQELAGRLKTRQHEVDTLQRIGAKEDVLKPVRDALAANEQEMKELQGKARVLQSGGDAAIALVRAQRSLLASTGALSALEQVHADLSAVCKELINGPKPKENPVPPAEAARAKGKQRKPRAPEANGSIEAAAPEAVASPAAARADAPLGKSGSGSENKPRPAQRRGSASGPAKEVMSDAERMRAARDKAKAELGIKGQRGAPSRAPTANPRPVANGAAQYRPAAPPPEAKNPWKKKVPAPSSTEQPANGHAQAPAAAAAATKAVAPSLEGTTELINGHEAEPAPASAASSAFQENGAAHVENGSMVAA